MYHWKVHCDSYTSFKFFLLLDATFSTKLAVASLLCRNCWHQLSGHTGDLQWLQKLAIERFQHSSASPVKLPESSCQCNASSAQKTLLPLESHREHTRERRCAQLNFASYQSALFPNFATYRKLQHWLRPPGAPSLVTTAGRQWVQNTTTKCGFQTSLASAITPNVFHVNINYLAQS